MTLLIGPISFGAEGGDDDDDAGRDDDDPPPSLPSDDVTTTTTPAIAATIPRPSTTKATAQILCLRILFVAFGMVAAVSVESSLLWLFSSSTS